MSLKREKVWFRVAGIAKRIKDLQPPPHWRFEVAGEEGQHLLHDFCFLGQATTENNRPGVNPRATGNALIAWIAGFGNISVDENGKAEFTLLPPDSSCPWD